MSSFSSFWLPSFLMGFGIAVDVIIATISQFQNKELSIKSWSAPITATHILFPAAGYYGVWGLIEFFRTTDITVLGFGLAALAPVVSFSLGMIGFVLVTLFVYEVFCEAADFKPVFAISAWFGKKVGLKEDDARLIIAILAVSWDALWSGPAKAAQTEGWTNAEVLWSFVVAGGAVFVFAQLALIIAFWMRRANFHNAVGMGRFTFWGKYLELSIIGGFGVLALWNGLIGDKGNLYGSIGISAIVMLVLFQMYEEQIANNEVEEAKDAIKGEA